MAMPIAGAQLFTVREFTKTIPEIADTLKKVADIGYTAVQLSGGGFATEDPKQIARLCKDLGLAVASTHMKWERYLNELDAVIEEHKDYGCSDLAIGGLSQDYRSVEGVKRFADQFAPIAERLAKEGMTFSYHNHNMEFVRHGEKVWLELMFDQVPGLCFELDTYWVQAGGACPVAWIKKCRGLCPLLHYKDMAITPQREQVFAPVGEGNLDWPSIVAASEASGAKYALVEQDRCYDRDPFDCLAISCRNMKSWGLR